MIETVYKIVFVRLICLFFCGERKILTTPSHHIYPFFCGERNTSTFTLFCASLVLAVSSITLKIYLILANCITFHLVQLKNEEVFKL